MNLYIMRHGTTVWNEKGIIQGRSKNRLSLTGVSEVQEQAKKFTQTKFDIIISSPLMRTMQTANIMNKFHNVKIIKDERLIEIDKGIFERRLKKSLTEEEKILHRKRDKSCGMESGKEVFARSKDFVNYLKTLNFDNVLVVTHQGNATMIENIILHGNFDFENLQLTFKNAEIKCFKV